ncbi:MAG: hypothetical protein JXB32_17980 [Deltaproteobacteria bacterium]|nr:hypothetical protein [Deltaproteobacteria bacterium]
MLPGFGGLGDGHQLSGLGDAASETARLRQLQSNMEANADLILTTYGPAVNAFANMAAAADSGDYARIEQSIFETQRAIATIVGMVPVVGPILSAVLSVLTAVQEWLVKTYPATAVDCFSRGQHLKEVCQGYRGSQTEDVLTSVYRDEGRFWLGTILTRGDTWRSWSVARNSENLPKWSDPPEVPKQGRMDGDVFYADLVDFNGRSLAQQREVLREFCYPLRAFFTTRPPAALGASSWFQFLRDHPDPEGSVAAIRIGEEVHRKLLADGDPKLVSGEYNGGRCRHVGFLVKCTGFPDATLIALLKKICDSQGPSDAVAEAAKIVAREEDRAGGMMYWVDGLAESVWHFIYNSPFPEYHFKALLDEYSRRGLGAVAMRLAPMARELTPLIVLTRKTKTETGMSTGAKVAVGVGVTGVVAGLLKLLKVW